MKKHCQYTNILCGTLWKVTKLWTMPNYVVHMLLTCNSYNGVTAHSWR